MNNNNTHNVTKSIAEAKSIFFVQQPDTISQKHSKDTVKSSTLGIDPLFLMIERKAQEVEVYREQAASKVRYTKPAQIVSIDTTCHICPNGEPIPLHNQLINSTINDNPFGLVNLFDKEYYQKTLFAAGPVFIETNKTESNTFSGSELKIAPRIEKSFASDWMLIPLVAVVLTLGILKRTYFQQLSVFFRSTVFFFVSSKITRESSVLWNRIFFSLDLIYFISVPLLLAYIAPYFNFTTSSNYGILSLALFILLGVIVFRIFRFASTKLIGYVSDHSEVFDTLYTNQLLYTRALGVVIVPFLIILGYSTESVRIYALYFLATISVIVLLFRVFRTLQVFINKGFSLFYLILYLCALEIIPILIIYNEVFGE
jgi:hypothetical protein